MNTLVIYFSVNGNTRKVAQDLASTYGYDLIEIQPKESYSMEDINWRIPTSRCNREYKDNLEVETIGDIEHFETYEKVYIGFPIWYGAAPNAVHSFCDRFNWQEKEIIVFATSGGGPLGNTKEKFVSHIHGYKSFEAYLVKEAKEIMA